MARQIISGVYCITNTMNGHRYIGSSVHLQTRFIQHVNRLRANKSRSKHLQAAWNKYGEDCFVFKILVYCDRTMTLYYEQQCLEKLQPEYNWAQNASAPMLGIRFSEEHRRNISEAQKGERGYWFGTHLSDEAKHHLSEVNKGKQFSEETRRKLRETRNSRGPISEETRQRMSKSAKERRRNGTTS